MANNNCSYCENPYVLVGKGTCGDVSPNNFICTREKDHGGVHVACELGSHCIRSWRNDAGFYSQCGRCGKPLTDDEAEACFYCTGALCADCWDKYGHCGHPEADRINEEARKVHGPQQESA